MANTIGRRDAIKLAGAASAAAIIGTLFTRPNADAGERPRSTGSMAVDRSTPGVARYTLTIDNGPKPQECWIRQFIVRGSWPEQQHIIAQAPVAWTDARRRTGTFSAPYELGDRVSAWAYDAANHPGEMIIGTGLGFVG